MLQGLEGVIACRVPDGSMRFNLDLLSPRILDGVDGGAGSGQRRYCDNETCFVLLFLIWLWLLAAPALLPLGADGPFRFSGLAPRQSCRLCARRERYRSL